MNALSAIYKGEIGANQSNSAAELSRMEGSAAQRSSYYNAGGTILSGIGQATGYAGAARNASGRNPALE
jgi:hypothetical protein